MGYEYVALNHNKKLVYDLGKFPVYLLKDGITRESVRFAVDGFAVSDKDQYAAMLFDALNDLGPDEIVQLDDEGKAVSLYGDYYVCGSKLKAYDDYVFRGYLANERIWTLTLKEYLKLTDLKMEINKEFLRVRPIPTKREQSLVDICFQLALVQHNNPWFVDKSQEEVAAWVADQLNKSGFPTEPRGLSWGVL